MLTQMNSCVGRESVRKFRKFSQIVGRESVHRLHKLHKLTQIVGRGSGKNLWTTQRATARKKYICVNLCNLWTKKVSDSEPPT